MLFFCSASDTREPYSILHVQAAYMAYKNHCYQNSQKQFINTCITAMNEGHVENDLYRLFV